MVEVDAALIQNVEVDPIGDVVLNYRIASRLGVGGMGVVYRGEHTVLKKKAALKVLKPGVAQLVGWTERFLAEANTLGQLNHRHIVKIENIDTLRDGRLCIIMEFLEGETLKELIERVGPLTPWEAVNYTTEVLSALAAAHSERIYHRDIKPENVFLVEERAGQPYAKVMDFGLAASVPFSASVETQSARESLRIGTPQYVSPEQTLGLSPTPASDLYSVGTMLFEALTGKLPFSAASVQGWIDAQQNLSAPRVETLVGDLPKPLCDLVDELLRKDPKDRPPSAAQVRNRLEEIRETLDRPSNRERTQMVSIKSIQPPSADTTTQSFPDLHGQPTAVTQPTLQPTRPAPRSLAPWIALATVALLVVGGGVAWVVLKERAQPAHEPLPTKVFAELQPVSKLLAELPPVEPAAPVEEAVQAPDASVAAAEAIDAGLVVDAGDTCRCGATSTNPCRRSAHEACKATLGRLSQHCGVAHQGAPRNRQPPHEGLRQRSAGHHVRVG